MKRPRKIPDVQQFFGEIIRFSPGLFVPFGSFKHLTSKLHSDFLLVSLARGGLGFQED